MLLTLIAHSFHSQPQPQPQRALDLFLQTTSPLALSLSCFLISKHKNWVELCWKMLAVEELLSELAGEEVNEQGLPPGFRFHPTDEELVTFYLASKVFNGTFCGVEIAEVDLNRCEPWELPDVAKMGEREWYFFSLKDRKYPSGLRTNRATGAGYWKTTGKDREVYSGSRRALLGMKKTLVFYKGRAPRGEKTKWVMHEYRLDGDFSCRPSCKEEWVICRIFNKTGEKKNALDQGQSNVMAVSSSSATLLPPLLETPGPASFLESPSQTLMQAHNSYLIHRQEKYLKSLINTVVPQSQSRLFPSNGFLSTTSTTTASSATDKHTETNANYSSASMPFKSLLSHQGCISKEQATIHRLCKTEANFSHLDSNTTMKWLDKIHPNPLCQNPILEMDYSVLGFSGGAVTGHDMSTSIAFNTASGQIILNPPATASGESWPLDC